MPNKHYPQIKFEVVFPIPKRLAFSKRLTNPCHLPIAVISTSSMSIHNVLADSVEATNKSPSFINFSVEICAIKYLLVFLNLELIEIGWLSDEIRINCAFHLFIKQDLCLQKQRNIMRKETDFLGERSLPKDAKYGIHSLRASENFPVGGTFPMEWYCSTAIVKLAVYNTYSRFKKAAKNKYKGQDLPIDFFDDAILDALQVAAIECSEGQHYEHFIVPAYSGGAGTSQNMNVNEIITNRALELLGYEYGQYNKLHPIEHANIYQSTNDVMPTALKTAIMFLLNELEDKINDLRSEIEKLETKYRNTLRLAFTQMQQAVHSTYGRLFSAYNEALSRDWWRVSKCFERIKQVNLGGSAVGTALTVPRYFVMEMTQELSQLTELPLTRSENLSDATQNLDSIVEVHAILKAHAVNIEKISADMRLLAADVRNINELSIPQKQAGSSIMPGKVNPVIIEYAISAATKV